MRPLLVLLALPLAGCVSLTPDHIRELVKDRNATAVCVKANAILYGTGTLVIAGIDKGVHGGVQVAPDCSVTIMTGGSR